ncbi:MAG TPA: four helix bundle protein [Kofleriaceae bacterium]|jgi:four helix bundle protein
MTEFEHERLDVYRVTIEFLVASDAVAQQLPRGRAYLADQLRRAGSSISFNIAEGAGEFAPNDKARFYRMARRSATECAAILDACHLLAPSDDDTARVSARELLLRIVAMLTAMVLRVSSSS